MENSDASLRSRALNVRTGSRTPSVRRAETDDSELAGRMWAREVDAPWDPCLLTLDGGGIRGYSSLLILKALMHEVYEWEKKLDEEEASQPFGDAAASEPGRGRRRDVNATRDQGVATVPRDSADAQGTASAAGPSISPSLVQENVSVNGTTSKQPAASDNLDATAAGSTDDRPTQQTDPLSSDVGFTLTSSVEIPTNNLRSDNLTTEFTKRKAIIEEELLPCHYFDFMYGTSTGGLIATMLGRLRMTVTECLEVYRKVGDDLFGRKRSSIPLTTKYYHEPLEKAVQDIVGSRCHEHENCDGKLDLHPWQFEGENDLMTGNAPWDVGQPRVCQSCCLTATHDESISEAYLLRTYPHYYADDTPDWITRYNEGADDLKIWQVTRATSAAPFYFKMLEAEVEGVKKAFKDGGIRENNPSSAAYSEFRSLYNGKTKVPALLLSVGTGRPDQKQDGFASAWPGPLGHLPIVRSFVEKRAVLANLLIKYTEGEKLHSSMKTKAEGENTWYKRLNVSEGLGDMPLDSWISGTWMDPHKQEASTVPGGASLTKMEDKTEAYLRREFYDKIDSYAPPSTMLRQAAEKLVRQRRAREAEGGVRWETFIGKYLHRKEVVDGHTG